MKATTCTLAAMLLMVIAGTTAHAAVTTFSDKAVFLQTTGARDQTGPLPNVGAVDNGPVTVGNAVFWTPAGGPELAFGSVGTGDWTTMLPGPDLTLFGRVELGVNLFTEIVPGVNWFMNVNSFGFDFVEPSLTLIPAGAFYDSTFAVTLFNIDTVVDSFTFNAPEDVAAFVGVQSDTPFNRVEIREAAGGVNATLDREYFGRFYASPVTPVPEPSALALMVLGAVSSLGLMLRRKKS